MRLRVAIKPELLTWADQLADSFKLSLLPDPVWGFKFTNHLLNI